MHIIDPRRFQEALKDKGYKSIGGLAKSLGVHRNSIHYYLSGNSVFPDVVEKILEALDLKPHEILMEKREGGVSPLEKIAPVVDDLHKNFPAVTFVLFGSRARGSSHKYSDWDIGIYSKEGIDHKTHLRIIQKKDELIQNLPFFVDIINLHRADENFLKNISKGWSFLTGSLSDWIELNRKAAA